MPGAREPKFGCVKLGTCLQGSITVRAISAVEERGHALQHEAVTNSLPRGAIFQPLTAVGQDERGRHEAEYFSDTQCFATAGCALWMQSTYSRERSNSGLFKFGRNPEATTKCGKSPAMDDEEDTDMVQVSVQWKGVSLELPFCIKTVRVQRDHMLLQEILSKRMDWNPLLADYNWAEFRYMFNPDSGTLFEAPKSASRLTQSAMALIGELDLGAEDVPHIQAELHDKQKAFRQHPAAAFKRLCQLPSARFTSGDNSEALLRHSITFYVST